MLAIRYDTADWATHFIPRWAAHMARHLDHLDVLALEVGDVGDLPPNLRVYSMGKAPGVSRARVLAGFYRHAARLIPRCDAVFVHMIPRYALLAAPLAVPLRKPLTLWYTHRNPSRDLKRALPLLRHVTTAVPSSFPLATDKVQALGHGIDAAFFTPSPSSTLPDQPPVIVQVARLQAIKNQAKLIAALPHLPGARAVFVGAVPHGEDETYPGQLRQLAADLGVAERVIFAGGQPAEQVRGWYWRAAVAVNLSPVGLFDKAALESMATATPTVVSNPAFDDLLGVHTARLRVDDPIAAAALADTLRPLLSLPPSERDSMGHSLRARVREAHSLEALIPRLLQVVKSA